MEKLLRLQKKLSQNLLLNCNMIKGSISSVCSSCNRANCICKTKSGNVAYRLTYKDKDQKTKTVYVPESQLKDMRKRIQAFRNAKEIIDDLVDINIEIFKISQNDISAKKK